MKKIIILSLIAIMIIFTLCGCGNMNLGFGEYEFRHGCINGKCVDISSWHDNDIGVEIHTTENGSIYAAEGTYILFDSKENCLFCNE